MGKTAPTTDRRAAGGDSKPRSGEGSTQRADPDARASMAAYIADMSAELADLANQTELTMLAYFLNLARVEAEMRSREYGGFEIVRHGPSRPRAP